MVSTGLGGFPHHLLSRTPEEDMIHSSFVSLKFQFQIHIYHNSLLICYKNVLIVKVFSIDILCYVRIVILYETF
jgi:hypothetical protein